MTILTILSVALLSICVFCAIFGIKSEKQSNIIGYGSFAIGFMYINGFWGSLVLQIIWFALVGAMYGYTERVLLHEGIKRGPLGVFKKLHKQLQEKVMELTEQLKALEVVEEQALQEKVEKMKNA